MHLCYIDESGTASIGNTRHFVLAGLSVPIPRWAACDQEIGRIKRRYALADEEIHTAWIMRAYLEQSKIPHFSTLSHPERRSAVERYRRQALLDLQRRRNPPLYRQTKKNYAKTSPYIHLTHEERRRFLAEVAACVSGWGFARLFAECVDKVHFDERKAGHPLAAHAFVQVASRFDKYLQMTENRHATERNHGLLIHDNNETVARKHTDLMRSFHQTGTLWTRMTRLIETPLFVDSKLTSMVQIADLCSYALRRYLDREETELFSLIYKRADRRRDQGAVVGVRHFPEHGCQCLICESRAEDGEI